MAFQRIQPDHEWRAERLQAVPAPWRGRIAREHAASSRSWEQRTERRIGEVHAGNAWLRDISAACVELLGHVWVPVDASDGELCDLADRCAREAFSKANGPAGFRTPEDLRAVLATYAGRYGIAEPAGCQDGPAIARMTDPAWWRRGLRRAQGRALERAAIRLGFVHRRDQIYASDATVQRRTEQRRRNAAALERTDAINMDTGEVYNLAELAALSVANPRIRRGELMVRIRGFEEIAAFAGDVGEFITLTCPSRFHARTADQAGRVVENPRYDGSTPREAQAHLTRTWANARAKLHRLGVRVYGFRIAEPHHDGCPHWHLLLFVQPDQQQALRDVLTHHALKVDGDEPGAKRNRVLFKAMDPGQGGAAGYIAKYVSKNIDGGGYVVQGDVEGHDSTLDPSCR